jgi:hypothetical protein|tara:strand:+ start:524 stop:1018 length:495 start_codon:yes stop_codon:yes gene_type:complete
MFKYKNKEIFPGKGWKDDEGVRHPKNWNIWSSAEKKERGIVEVLSDTPPDSRLYDWSGPDINGKITSTAKDLDTLKIQIKSEIQDQQFLILSKSDWTYIRHYDTGKDVPSNIKKWRNTIRTKATEMEDALAACSSVEDIAKLWLVIDKDGNKSGILYDWPELEE